MVGPRVDGDPLAFRVAMPNASPHEAVIPSGDEAITERREGPDDRTPVGISGGYQPALDGIRAIAVSIVILFHLGLAGYGHPLTGGWLGVDMFFVLSGYLITALLLAERRRSGRNNLPNFYVRRILRLAPLSILLVVVCWIGQRVGPLSVLDLSLTSRGAISIVFYFSNWMFLLREGSTGSLMHAWSLSIEEQFYLIWPALVIGVFAVSKRNARWVLAGLAVVAAAVCGLYRRHLWYQALAGGSGDHIWRVWERFYFSSFQRPDGLVIGCLLALLLHGVRPTRMLRIIVSILGVIAAVIAASIVYKSAAKLWLPWVPFLPAWGLSAMNVSVAVVLAALVLHPTSLGARALSIRPLRWVGRRAYGIYLFHPIVINLVLNHSTLRSGWSALVAVAGTLLLAAASFRWFETPFLRLKDRFPSQVARAPSS